ncbi:hypothetical protein JWJ90_10765 [Desulfobulbus rhabdoformis]|uniref:hypothetical protein n=1 Tax=Desulfobulbus rhabdoformis TaxID=34032 RepID=UPI0019636154|nr:hypothetical protein [Desulfobulbus rhabdoformis]MBM9614765.1 hypothetical protein [Desulfobulbus rhabdoformis]
MAARFEVFDHSELEAGIGERQDPLEQPKILITKAAVSTLLKDAESALATIGAIQEGLQNKIAGIDSQLKTNIILERTQALRRESQALLDDNLKIIRDTALEANKQKKFWSKRSVRVRANFDDDPVKDATIRLTWIRRLEKLNSAHMEEVASMALQLNSLALAHCVEAELEARYNENNPGNRGDRQTVKRLLDAIPDASTEVLGMIAEINRIADLAPAVARGNVNGFAKIKSGLRQRIQQ